MLRGALIGAGNVALRGHLPAFRNDQVRERAEIVAVVDVVGPRGGEVDPLLAGATFHPDLESLLRHERVDFADICTPPDVHAACVLECAAAGLDVMCEKPLTHRPSDVPAVAHAVREAGIVFVPCHQYKYAPLWWEVHRAVQSGVLGQVTLAQFNVFRTGADVGSSRWNPTWRTRKQHGGGILADTGAHYFYLSRWLFGMPARISAVLCTLRHHDYGVEDTAAVTLEHPRHLVEFNLTWAANRRATEIHVVGTEGSLHYDGTRLLVVDGAGERIVPMANVADKSQYVAWYAALASEFLRRIEERDISPDLLEEAEDVMRLLGLAYGAAESGARADVG